MKLGDLEALAGYDLGDDEEEEEEVEEETGGPPKLVADPGDDANRAAKQKAGAPDIAKPPGGIQQWIAAKGVGSSHQSAEHSAITPEGGHHRRGIEIGVVVDWLHPVDSSGGGKSASELQ